MADKDGSDDLTLHQKFLDAVSQLHHYSMMAEKGIEEAKKMKDCGNLGAIFAEIQKVMKLHENFDNGVIQLAQLLADPQNKEAVMAEIKILDQQEKGEEDKAKATFQMMIAFLRVQRHQLGGVCAENEEVKGNSPQEFLLEENTLEGTLTRLGRLAQELLEMKK